MSAVLNPPKVLVKLHRGPPDGIRGQHGNQFIEVLPPENLKSQVNLGEAVESSRSSLCLTLPNFRYLKAIILG